VAALLEGRPRLKQIALTVAAGVGILSLLVALGAARSNRHAHSGRPTVAPAAGNPGDDPAGETEPQALAAGVGDATLMARLFPLDPAAARAALAQTASDAYRDELVAAVAAELVPLQRQVAGLAGQPIYRQSVLAAQVGSYAPPRAQVAAWVMITAGQAGVADNATAAFATVTVELVFEHDAWKLDHTSEEPGPSPEVLDAPTSVDSLVSRLNGFADWRPTS
jgi:hypothetical protein